jgi:hypothetical protein
LRPLESLTEEWLAIPPQTLNRENAEEKKEIQLQEKWK